MKDEQEKRRNISAGDEEIESSYSESIICDDLRFTPPDSSKPIHSDTYKLWLNEAKSYHQDKRSMNFDGKGFGPREAASSWKLMSLVLEIEVTRSRLGSYAKVFFSKPKEPAKTHPPDNLPTSAVRILRLLYKRDEFDDVYGSTIEGYRKDFRQFGAKEAKIYLFKDIASYICSALKLKFLGLFSGIVGYFVGSGG